MVPLGNDYLQDKREEINCCRADKYEVSKMTFASTLIFKRNFSKKQSGTNVENFQYELRLMRVKAE